MEITIPHIFRSIFTISLFLFIFFLRIIALGNKDIDNITEIRKWYYATEGNDHLIERYSLDGNFILFYNSLTSQVVKCTSVDVDHTTNYYFHDNQLYFVYDVNDSKEHRYYITGEDSLIRYINPEQKQLPVDHPETIRNWDFLNLEFTYLNELLRDIKTKHGQSFYTTPTIENIEAQVLFIDNHMIIKEVDLELLKQDEIGSEELRDIEMTLEEQTGYINNRKRFSLDDYETDGSISAHYRTINYFDSEENLIKEESIIHEFKEFNDLGEYEYSERKWKEVSYYSHGSVIHSETTNIKL